MQAETSLILMIVGVMIGACVIAYLVNKHQEFFESGCPANFSMFDNKCYRCNNIGPNCKCQADVCLDQICASTVKKCI